MKGDKVESKEEDIRANMCTEVGLESTFVISNSYIVNNSNFIQKIYIYLLHVFRPLTSSVTVTGERERKNVFEVLMKRTLRPLRAASINISAELSNSIPY